ncbi:MAG: hypothetical protein HC806_10510 [Anaerolineae bacterium]|nr:hypothetical protein [Anaerolineae bacterium]
MDFIQDHLLTLILFSPTFVALLMVFLPSNEDNLNRWVAFVGSLIPLIFTLILWFSFDRTQTGFQFEEQAVWYSAINSSYHLGVDGISLPMVLLTTILTPLAILASFGIKDRVKAYMILFLFWKPGC